MWFSPKLRTQTCSSTNGYSHFSSRTLLLSKMVKIPTISPAEFRALLKPTVPKTRIIPVDASWYMPNNPRDAKDEFLNKERLGNSAFFDLDKISLEGARFPHTLPKYAPFNKAIRELGIIKSDHLVVYDRTGIFSSPRVAWTLSLFGHKSVSLLDNYVKYTGEKLPLSTDPVSLFATPLKLETEFEASITELEFDANYKEQVIKYEELLDLVSSGELTKKYILFDARSKDRFTGEAPEPREGLSSGHIPGSLSLPFTKLLEGGYKSKSELLSVFKEEFGFDLSDDKFLDGKKIIVLCGSGVTAVIIKLAIQSVIGLNVPVRVYDGSWTEWGSLAPSEFIVKGEQ